MKDVPFVARVLVTLLKLLLFGIVFSLISGILILPFVIFGEKSIESIDPLISVYAQLIATLITIFIFYRFNKKKMTDLGFSLRGHVKEFWTGSGIAIVIMLISFGILLLFKQIGAEANAFDVGAFLSALVLFIGVAVFEEVLCRGYILGTLMDSMNKYAALIISSAIFALMHLPNNHIAPLPVFNLFLAGILLGSAYIYTRNLWFPIGMHLFWNFTQGTLLGFNVSGQEIYSILRLEYPENNFFNGGAFGLEGSFLISAFSIAAIVLVLRHYKSISQE
ncbi:membrane protease YdiL (CAAX protease family) [Parabacteroides sp. PF5-5]|uniref:CPBP family intramembrane glutamic endopeptidase n=1 Tax=unclassified Parabacteroides TaxID=2649774 RepID=UPI00247506A8|nr:MULTISPECIES: type II CAAX endopeptidase family protein [unclassified Parabacteroides]MDH6306438.1 membrane protease YdiL (CAAX protease family) [Parabacteroides sp. PH5-39]MDH6317410.1 membrane protease YdiL (CAAX protease family) [Parabacteroides sp. PF5-13]MDH6321149.1 membrane protease YdiL (CAAX protease family) [Parabacteroides sp. PH5-13]MDH6324881.1 membrane protease YdiL (CAAX protease family) [Parabacteroides sp. PH5-8]MDH6328595.1 membrane protease YdiL (CAAX protease family) [Pa